MAIMTSDYLRLGLGLGLPLVPFPITSSNLVQVVSEIFWKWSSE